MRRVRVGSPAHTRSILRDYHRAWTAHQREEHRMGYESTLVFGTYAEPSLGQRERGQVDRIGTYLQIVSTIDLSKMDYNGPFARLLKESPVNDSNLFLYLRDGDKQEHVDPYGDPFKVLDAERLLIVLEKEAGTGYRRAELALDVVRAWICHSEKFQGPGVRAVILHYGH